MLAAPVFLGQGGVEGRTGSALLGTLSVEIDVSVNRGG